MSYPLGNLVNVVGIFRDKDNVKIDPEVVYCTIKDPNSDTTTYTYGTDVEVVKESTGIYSLDIDVDTAGTWYYRWWSTGDGQAAREGSFVVEVANVTETENEMTATNENSSSTFDAEYHIGLVANSAAHALSNTVALNLALAAMKSNGSFRFKNGVTGPVTKMISFAAKEFFFQGTIQTNTRLGGGMIGSGGLVYLMGSNQFQNSGTLGGIRTVLTRIDGENGGAVIRLRGQGFLLQGLCIMGRKYSTEDGVTGPTEGTATPIGIEVEGRTSPATGRPVIRDCLIASCTYGIACRAGYHNSGTNLTYAGIDGLHDLLKDENHGEGGVVENVMFSNCDNCFYSENVQSIIWRFTSIRVGWLGTGSSIVFRIVRGGNIYVQGLELILRDVVILQVHRDATEWQYYTSSGTNYFKDTQTACPGNNPDPHDYSPYTATFECIGMKYDGYSGSGTNYLTLFKYAGPNYIDAPDMQSFQWNVRMTGHIAHPPVPYFGGSPDYNYSRLIEINDSGNLYKVPRSCLLFDILNLPTTNFTITGSGPWYHPN